MITTAFTTLVGCRVPLQLAGMGSIAGVDLAAAVSNAGGLGMVAFPMVPAPALEALLTDLARRTEAPFGINFLMPFLDADCVRIAAQHARVVEFFYAEPDPSLVASARGGGALVAWQVGSVDEARSAADAGVDFLIAQGTEAGGHVRGNVPLLPLLSGVLEAVDVPVVAAGGISTPRAMAAALAAGASAVRVGTLFVAAAEADAHPRYVEALIGARGEDTVLTEAYEVMWPNAPHRVLRSALERARSLTAATVGEITMGDVTMPVPRFAPMAATRSTTGDIDAMALYAGQGVDAVREIRPAADIVRDLAEGAEELLRSASNSLS